MTGNGVERRPELVRHDGEKLTLRARCALGLETRHALRLEQALMLFQDDAHLPLADTERFLGGATRLERLAQTSLQLAAMLHLGLENSRPLLEDGHLHHPRIRLADHKPRGRSDVRVMIADRLKSR